MQCIRQFSSLDAFFVVLLPRDTIWYAVLSSYQGHNISLRHVYDVMQGNMTIMEACRMKLIMHYLIYEQENIALGIIHMVYNTVVINITGQDRNVNTGNKFLLI